MSSRIGIVIYGPEKSSNFLLMQKIHELYRGVAMHDIRHLGGGGIEGINYCEFQIGDIIYEFYVPPSESALKVLREKLAKRASAIIFVAPASKAYLDKTYSLISELKHTLFAKLGPEAEHFPLIYAINISKRTTIVDMEPKDLIEALRLPHESIIRVFDIDDETAVRGLFGTATHLSFLWNFSKKQYFIELDEEFKATESKYFKIMQPTEVISPEYAELFVEERARSRETPHPRIISVSDSIKNKLARNYINEITLLKFDSTVGYIPLGFIFGAGKIVKYIEDPTRIAELSIIAKHSIGTLFVDGFTTVGFIKLADQGLLVLESTIHHMRKMINIIKELQDKVSHLTLTNIEELLMVLSKSLS
ncbi:MAG: hypothetical protein QXH98_03780 [Candidatus Korarchaeota archaeon]|nr:hypothetical protein [Thermoproteota archaeon]